MTPEGKVKAAARKILTDMGVYFFPVNQGLYGRSGIPDDCACIGGRFVQIEYKADMDWTSRTKKAYASLPTVKQVAEMEKCRNSGGVTLLIDKHNLRWFSIAIQELMRGKWNGCCTWRYGVSDYMAYLRGECSIKPEEYYRYWELEYADN